MPPVRTDWGHIKLLLKVDFFKLKFVYQTTNERI